MTLTWLNRLLQGKYPHAIWIAWHVPSRVVNIKVACLVIKLYFLMPVWLSFTISKWKASKLGGCTLSAKYRAEEPAFHDNFDHDGGKLFCSFCEHTVDWTLRDMLVDHQKFAEAQKNKNVYISRLYICIFYCLYPGLCFSCVFMILKQKWKIEIYYYGRTWRTCHSTVRIELSNYRKDSGRQRNMTANIFCQ